MFLLESVVKRLKFYLLLDLDKSKKYIRELDLIDSGHDNFSYYGSKFISLEFLSPITYRVVHTQNNIDNYSLDKSFGKQTLLSAPSMPTIREISKINGLLA